MSAPRFLRSPGLSVAFGPGRAFTVRVPARGLALRVPPQAVALLQACDEPRTEEEIAAVHGDGMRPLFRELVRSGLLLDPDAAAETAPFFESFARLDVHHRMLADRVRLEAYALALREVVQPGMAVLDAGTGSGVLAVMAAFAGARCVYAVDRSDFLDIAASVVAENGVQDRVRLVAGDFARVELPEKVDVVVTETFGAMALTEGSAPDLHACCARNLAPGGRVVPDRVDLHLGLSDSEALVHESTGPFAPAFGVSFEPLRRAAFGRAGTHQVDGLAAEGACFCRLPYPGGGTFAEGNVRFPAFQGTLRGFVGWFDLHLSDGVTLSTGPDAPPTHWGQTWAPLDAPRDVDGDVDVRVRLAPAPGNRRLLEMALAWSVGDWRAERVWGL